MSGYKATDPPSSHPPQPGGAHIPRQGGGGGKERFNPLQPGFSGEKEGYSTSNGHSHERCQVGERRRNLLHQGGGMEIFAPLVSVKKN